MNREACRMLSNAQQFLFEPLNSRILCYALKPNVARHFIVFLCIVSEDSIALPSHNASGPNLYVFHVPRIFRIPKVENSNGHAHFFISKVM
jgi:hypothetical protein